MKKRILQIENISKDEFKKELFEEIQIIIERLNSKFSINQSDALLTREETAEILSISLVTLWKWTKDGLLPSYRIGKKIRYKKSEIILSLKQANKFQ